MQTRRQSWVEAVVGTAIGFVVSMVVLQFIVSPIFHIPVNLEQNVLITLIFTVTSVLRSYLVRRFFNSQHTPKRPPAMKLKKVSSNLAFWEDVQRNL